jgi:hypothetical protein
MPSSGVAQDERRGEFDTRLMPGLQVADSAPTRTEAVRHLRASTIAMLMSAFLLYAYYDKTWYPPDEGNYATVAERVLNGEVLNRQVQDIHPGYVTFVNAAALGIFGLDLLSLRYPLILASLVQAAAILLVFPPEARWRAAVAAVGATALGAIQFLNPTAHWPCLALTTVLVALLARTRRSVGQLVAAGLLIGTIALFRQLTGFFVGLGALTYLIASLRDADAAGSEAVLARIVLATMIVSLSAYLIRATDVSGIALFGVWPVALLARLLFRPQPANRAVVALIGWIAAGIALSATPLVAYHLLHGSLSGWANDVGPAAIALTRLEFFQRTNFGAVVAQSLRQMFSGSGVPAAVNGLYWVVLSILAVINGVLVHLLLRRSTAIVCSPLPVIAVFYAVVSAHFQIPLYLYFSVGLTLSSILWVAPAVSPGAARLSSVGALGLASIAVIFHAGQPTSRGVHSVLLGDRYPAPKPSGLPHCSLKIDAEEAGTYRQLVDVITTHTREGESIFAVPSNAELYFLTQRRNPFRFYNTALGVRTDADLEEVRQVIRDRPPRVVTYNPHDKYNSPRSRQILEEVRAHYVLVGRVDPFEVYALP